MHLYPYMYMYIIAGHFSFPTTATYVCIYILCTCSFDSYTYITNHVYSSPFLPPPTSLHDSPLASLFLALSLLLSLPSSLPSFLSPSLLLSSLSSLLPSFSPSLSPCHSPQQPDLPSPIHHSLTDLSTSLVELLSSSGLTLTGQPDQSLWQCVERAKRLQDREVSLCHTVAWKTVKPL